MNLRCLRNKIKKQNGAVFVQIIIFILIIVLILIMLLAIVHVITIPKGNQNTNDGTGGGKLAQGETNNLPGKGDTNNQFVNKDTNNLPSKEDDIQDLSTGYLVCVNLFGMSSGRTPALDRRVAQMYLQVKRDLDAQGVPPIGVSWAFRSNCQQINVKPSNNKHGVNPKAKPGTSPHEAGRALDIKGMLERRDAGQIVATFRKHGWIWLGEKDPPHFEVLGLTVGEPSHYKWIQKIQQSFKQGYPKEGCRGPECAD